MALILSIETATDICSVALSENNTIIDSVSMNERNVHSARLALLINHIITENNRQYSDLNAIAVSIGPGSFTGLRIGVSLAKGLVYGLDIPLIGINTLEAIAWQANLKYGRPGIIWCPVIDARNNEVYFALYDHQMNEVVAPDAGVISPESFTEIKQKASIRYTGPAVDSATLPNLLNQNADFVYEILPDAQSICRLAYPKYLKQQFEDITFFEPFYLRDFKAKNLSTRIKKVLNSGNDQQTNEI